MPPIRPAVALLALAAVAGVALWRSAPPRPRGADAAAARFSATRAEEVLRRLVGDEAPRPLGSEELERFRGRVTAELEGLGLTPVVERGVACSPRGSCAHLANVLAELPGAAAGPAVLLVAHYDSVGAGPGVSDNAASVACLLEVARALSTAPRRNPVLLLVDDGEEAGLLGAELFVASPRAQSVGVVVNLEARGTTGASFLFETSRDNAWLVRRAVARMPRPVTSSVFSFVYDRLPNDTDLTVFKREGMAGLNLAFVGSAARYHTREDSLANLSRASLQHHGDNTLALARALAETDLASPPPGAAVFFDLAGLGVLWWPRGASAALALIAFVLVRAACVRRGGWLVPRARALLPLLSPLLAVAVAAAVWQLLRIAGAVPVFFVATSQLATLAVAAAALAVALPALAAEYRWTGSAEEGWERAWTSTAILGILLAAAVPEACFLLVAPALVAGVCRLLLSEAASAWIPFTFLGLLLLPLALRMPEVLGGVGLPLAAAGLAVTLAAAPLDGARGTVRGPVIVLVVLAAAASTATLFRPATTPTNPEHGSMVLVEEEGVPAAKLAYRPSSGRLRLATALRFETATDVPPWGRGQTAFVTPLEPTGKPFPTLELLAEEPQGDGRRRLTLRLVSPRGATTVGLVLAAGVAAEQVRVDGRPLAPPYRRRPDRGGGAARVICHAVPAEGVVVELTLPLLPCEAFLFDRSPGLPESALPVAEARPPAVAPVGDGDVTVLYRRLDV